MPTIGLLGFGDTNWQSLTRTKSSYLSAFNQLGWETVNIPRGLSWFPEEPDVVFSFAGNAGWASEKIRKCPLLIAVHGGAVLNHEFISRNAPRLRETDGLIVNCSSDIAILNAIFDKKRRPGIHLLPLPVDSTRFFPTQKKEAKEILGLGSVDILLGYMGRILPQRNLHRFIEIVAFLQDKLGPGSEVGAIVVGQKWVDYPALNYFKRDYGQYVLNNISLLNLEKKVHFFPFFTCDEELSLAYSAMDMLLHPSNAIDENFGYVPVEAMSCATPVVAYAYGGIKDTVRHGKTGLLVPTWISRNGIRFDQITAYNACHFLSMNTSLREKMGQAGRRHVVSNYSFARFCGDMQKILEQGGASRRGGRYVSSVGKILGLSKQTEPLSDLPSIDIPWSYYAPAAGYYASGPMPTVVGDCRVGLFAPLKRRGFSFFADDPTWPCQYQFTGDEKELIDLIGAYGPQGGLAGYALDAIGDTRLVHDLLDRGVVTVGFN